MFVKKKVFCGFLALSLFANTFSALPSNAFGFGDMVNAGKKLLGMANTAKEAVDTAKGIQQTIKGSGNNDNENENNNTQPSQPPQNNNTNPNPVLQVDTSRLDPTTQQQPSNNTFTPQLNKVQNKPLNVYMPLPNPQQQPGNNTFTPELNKIQNKPLNVYMPLPEQSGQPQGYLNNDGLPRASNIPTSLYPTAPFPNNPIPTITQQSPQGVNRLWEPTGTSSGTGTTYSPNDLAKIYTDPNSQLSFHPDIRFGGGNTTTSPYQLGQLLGGQVGGNIVSNPNNPLQVSSDPNMRFSPYNGGISPVAQNVLGLPQAVSTSGGFSDYNLDLSDPNKIVEICRARAADGTHNNRTCFIPGSPAEGLVKKYFEDNNEPYPTTLFAKQQQQDLKAALEKACQNGEGTCNFVKGQIAAGCDKPEAKDSLVCKEMASSGMTLTQPNSQCKEGGAWGDKTEVNCEVGIAKGITFESLSNTDKATLETIFGKNPSSAINSIVGSFNTNIGNIDGVANQINGALGFIDNPLGSAKNFLLGNVGVVLGRVLSEIGVSPSIANIVANIGQNIAYGAPISQAILGGLVGGIGGYGGGNIFGGNGIFGNNNDNNNLGNSIVTNIGPINQGVGGYDPNQIMSSAANGLPVYGPPAPGQQNVTIGQPYYPNGTAPAANTTIGTAVSQRVFPDGTRETTETLPDGSRTITTTTGDHKDIVALPPHPASKLIREDKDTGRYVRVDTGATVSMSSKKDYSQLNRAQGVAPPPKTR